MTARQIGDAISKLPKAPSGQDTTTQFKYYVQKAYKQFYDKDEQNPKYISDLKKATKVLNPTDDTTVKLPDQKLILKIAQMRYTIYRRDADEKLVERAYQAQAKADKKAEDKKKPLESEVHKLRSFRNDLASYISGNQTGRLEVVKLRNDLKRFIGD